MMGGRSATALAGRRPRVRLAAETGWRDRYVVWLCVALAGYAFIGRGFASLGVAPLFIGEAGLALGLLGMAAAGSYACLLATWPGLLLTTLLAWVAVRVVPGFQLYGVVALRDAVIAGYGLFALIVVALLVERPERLAVIVRLYGGFARVFGLFATPLFALGALFWTHLPTWPISQAPLISVRPGEIAVHLAGISVFTLAGLRRASPAWLVIVVLGVALISPSRGAMLAYVLPVAAAVVLTGQTARVLPWLLGAALLFAAAYALDLDIAMEGGRSIGPRQIVDNVVSLIGSSDAANLDNTKAWRLGWWHAIENYTFHGDYFWTGKGFGQSLAELDGFVVGEELGGPVLRSPHNAHLTILARAGVPGLALWAATCLSWFAMVLHASFDARRRGLPIWSSLFVWIACYVAAILIDASFDVALEGPMLGIWFWCLFGLGIGATMIYRASLGARVATGVRARMQQPYGRRLPGTVRLLPASLRVALGCALLSGLPHLAWAASTCPPGAIDVPRGQSIQAVVDRSPPLARFCIAPGIHRLESIVPKQGQQFFGRPGSVLNGARILAGFKADGDQWAAQADDPVGADHGVCTPGYPACARPAGLFVDGRRLRRAMSAAALAPDRFFFDPANRRLVLAADPTGHLVEWATTRHAFSGAASDVVVQGLVIEKYANPAQSGAVWPGGAGWRLIGIEARDNNGVGLVAGSDGLIDDCDVHGNGQLGIGAGGASGLVISGNHVWGNNTNGFDAEWEAGGIKVAQSRGVAFRDNHVERNAGPGLWCDEECRDVVISGNLVEANASAGIFYELSSDAVIRDNTLRSNGDSGLTWFWGAEIQVAASRGVVVTGNRITVRPGGRGVMLIDQNRARAGGGMYQTRDNRVDGNRTLFLGDGVTGGASDAAPGAANAGIIQAGGNRFDRDTYFGRPGTAIRFVWGGFPTSLATFREHGQELAGSLIDDPTGNAQP